MESGGWSSRRRPETVEYTYKYRKYEKLMFRPTCLDFCKEMMSRGLSVDKKK